MNVNDPRWASIDAFVEENRDNILRDITRLVAVPSVEGAPEPGAPFGPGPKAALAKALETLAGVIRDANGLPGKLDKERIADMRARRKLERQKAGLDRKDEDGGGVVLLPQVEEKADAGGMEAAAQAGDFHGQAGV